MADQPSRDAHTRQIAEQYNRALFAGLHDVADVLRAELDRLERRTDPDGTQP